MLPGSRGSRKGALVRAPVHGGGARQLRVRHGGNLALARLAGPRSAQRLGRPRPRQHRPDVPSSPRMANARHAANVGDRSVLRQHRRRPGRALRVRRGCVAVRRRLASGAGRPPPGERPAKRRSCSAPATRRARVAQRKRNTTHRVSFDLATADAAQRTAGIVRGGIAGRNTVDCQAFPEVGDEPDPCQPLGEPRFRYGN